LAERIVERLALKVGLSGLQGRERLMKIGFGFGYGPRATAAGLALVGLVALTCLHIRIPVISTAALAALARAQAVSEEARDQGATPPGAIVAAPLGAGVAAPAANGIRAIGNVCDWDKLDWDEMSLAEKQAWEALGWSRAPWESDNREAASSAKDWSELTPNERDAAERLGYNAQNWEADCPR
jgi:hypothetical protein